MSQTSEHIEKTGFEATFMYGKLEFSLEQAMARYDRLSQEDNFEVTERPRTVADRHS